jgi:hypothetical protein
MSIRFLLSDTGLFMSSWYAALQVVVEGYKELKLKDSIIDELLESPHFQDLRRFRNGTYHFQKGCLSPKLTEIHEDPDHVEWLRSLHRSLGGYLLDKVKGMLPNERREEIEEAIKRARE